MTHDASMTIGQSIRQNAAIQAAFETVLQEIDQQTASITEIRGPAPGLKSSYDDLIARAGEARGRALLYPYLGSGAGRGALVELADGSVKWDLVAGIGVHFMGHSHPLVTRAQLESALEDTTKHGNLQSGAIAYEFGEKLVAHAKKRSKLAHAYCTVAGTMANEFALKVCMQKRAPATRVLAFEHCFMGRSLTMTSIGDSAAARDGVPITVSADYLPFWNAAEAERVGGEAKFIEQTVAKLEEHIERYPGLHACFVMELIQGEGGFNVPPKAFLEALMKTCKRHGIPVWADEIQTFGRTTQMFAFEHFGLGEYIDVLCVGKMTHACAALWTAEMNPKAGLLSGTFTSGTVDFAVGNAIMDYLSTEPVYGEEGLFAQHQAAFRAQADALIARHPEWFPACPQAPELAGGVGGMMRLTPFAGDKAKVIAAAKAIYDAGAIVFWCGHGPVHLRLLPPMPAVQLSDYPRFFEVIERGLAAAAT